MFDANKSLDDNLAAFRAECEKLDADCAKILFDNIDVLRLKGADRDARSAFNAKVKAALEALPDPATKA
ncbi:hypothetical protein ACNI3Q_02780 [Sphingomonas sp. FW199]|uniref:hypothetical protein n=1 Tax=Sphingomonas sp. FW199 TaxID=3400217 RepID=UPI003CF56D74